jgi:hypothetical protein
MLQQEIYIQDYQGQECSPDDKQWRRSQDHQEMQDTRLQATSIWFGTARKPSLTSYISRTLSSVMAMYDSKVDTTFVVHCSAFGLPNMLFEMHPCGLHVCYPKNMGDFGFVQTVEDNMKLFSK